jgi:CHAT domain-containing protein/tetratricopeptide (TPR) repeat protein
MIAQQDTDNIRRLVDEVVLAARSDPTAAERLAGEIESIAKQNPSPLFEAYSHRAKGHVLQTQGKMTEAVRYYRSAHALFEQCLEPVEQARTASSLVGALVPLGEFEEALRLAEQAREVFQQANLPARAARLDVNIGNLYHRLNRLEDALSCYERAAQYLEHSNDHEAVAGILINRSVVLMLLYRFEESSQGFLCARNFSEQRGLHVFAAQSEYNRAYLLFLVGDYAQSLRLMQEAEAAFQKLGDAIHVAHCRSDRAEILLELNLPEYALGLATLAEDGFRCSGLNGDRARALLISGRCLARLNRKTEALKQYQQSRTLFHSEGNLIGASLADLETAAAMTSQVNAEAATQLVEEAGDVFRNHKHIPLSALADSLLARLHVENGDSGRALQLLHRCEQSLKSQLPANLQYHIQYLKGWALQVQGRVSEARECYRTATESLEFLLTRISVDQAMLRFLEGKEDAYERLASLSDNHQKAFELVDRARARALTAPWNLRRRPHPVSDKIRTLRDSLRSDHLRLFRSDNPQPDSLLDGISRKEHLFMQELLEEQFRQTADSMDDECATPTEAADEVFLEYFIRDESVAVFVVKNGKAERVTLPVSTSALQQELTFTRYGLSRPGNSNRESALRYHLEWMYDALIAPVVPLLTGRIVVIPHKFLSHLPFHLLLGPDGYLAEHYEISYAASMATYLRTGRRSLQASPKSLILGTHASNLPAAVDELRDVAGRLPDATVALDKSFEEIRSDFESATFIHIASHGLFRQDNPEWSLLNVGSDVLSPTDILNLQVNAELVTMSACSIGKTHGRGAEVQGFVRALLQWEVPSIVAALWQVDDSATSLLMRAFYNNFQDSPDIARNLRLAMLEVRRSFPHPYYWGGFVLFGRQKLGSSWEHINQAAAKLACTDSSGART